MVLGAPLRAIAAAIDLSHGAFPDLTQILNLACADRGESSELSREIEVVRAGTSDRERPKILAFHDG